MGTVTSALAGEAGSYSGSIETWALAAPAGGTLVANSLNPIRAPGGTSDSREPEPPPTTLPWLSKRTAVMRANDDSGVAAVFFTSPRTSTPPSDDGSRRTFAGAGSVLSLATLSPTWATASRRVVTALPE